MLPRKQSIFHLGEESCAAHHRAVLVGAATAGGVRRERLVVGLQILVHHHHHHGRHHAHAANVVLKQLVVRPPRAAPVSCSFLVACSLCRLELSPSKDVYIYRGDQGFCSEECRWQQIQVDEAREREAAAVISKERRRRGLQARGHRSPHHTPVRSRPSRTTLAAA